jgi:hypothetical protein
MQSELVLAPLFCKLLVSIPQQYIIRDLIALHNKLPSIDTKEKLLLATLLGKYSFPSENLLELQAKGIDEPAKLFYLAIIDDNENEDLVKKIRVSILADIVRATNVVTIMLKYIARFDLHDRMHFISEHLYIPFYALDMSFVVMGFLTHYNEDWVESFITHLRISRSHALQVRRVLLVDFSTLCIVIKDLKKLNIKGPLSLPELIVFLSVHTVILWEQLEWPYNMETMSKFVSLAQKGYTPSPMDAVSLCLKYTTIIH